MRFLTDVAPRVVPLTVCSVSGRLRPLVELGRRKQAQIGDEVAECSAERFSQRTIINGHSA